jgi:hypothetical protein
MGRRADGLRDGDLGFAPAGGVIIRGFPHVAGADFPCMGADIAGADLLAGKQILGANNLMRIAIV